MFRSFAQERDDSFNSLFSRISAIEICESVSLVNIVCSMLCSE